MYHFTADHPPEPVRLSYRALIRGDLRQYLKDFQLDAIRFMHNFLAKDEFCIYNDESGMGKQAAVVVLLDAACSTRKCLIVVQNDERYVTGWEFHFKVLTNTNVTVIKDGKDSTDSPHSVYIAKWSTLRTIDDLSKFKFDFVILDNRGQMLNNSFCTSMLLKHYERNVNILISSVDVTSDLKLLHNVLRLGGRLEPQYSNFKVFEEKFKLPDAKELAYKRVDLEEYFCKRERLANYCKNFRLRRYCHQFETQLPLVKEDRYKINLELWREKQNATNSESSSIEFINNKNSQQDQIKDTQELFEEYCRQRRKQHLQFQKEEEERLRQREQTMLRSLEAEEQPIYNVDDEVASISDTPPLRTEKPSPSNRENSDEPVLMSPLLVESDSDVDDIPVMFNPNSDIEIVDLSSEEQIQYNQNAKVSRTNGYRYQTEGSCKRATNTENGCKRKSKRSELDRLEEDIVDKLKLKEVTKRSSRHRISSEREETRSRRLNNRLKEHRKKNMCSMEETSKCTTNGSSNLKNRNNTKEKNTSVKINAEKGKEKAKDVSKITVKESSTTPKNKKSINDKHTTAVQLAKSSSNSIQKEKTTTKTTASDELRDATPLASRETRSAVIGLEQKKNKTTEKANCNPVQIKQELSEEANKTKKSISTDASAKKKDASEKYRLKRELEIAPAGIHLKQTRSMQRLTRSAQCSSKYLTKNVSLKIDKVGKCRKKVYAKGTIKTSAAGNKSKDLKEVEKNTQASVISHRSSQDYESLQCGQRLSEAGDFDQDLERTAEFLVPAAPNAAIRRNSLLPSSLTSSAGFLTESDVIFIQPSNSTLPTNKRRDQVVLLSSSDNENSTSQSSSTNAPMTSRRTRALKPRRIQQQAAVESSKVASFSDLLAQQKTRLSAKSPDLFSNCSDLIPLPCTQANLDNEEPNTPFEGFKIFGSEVKQMQQHYASAKNTNKPDTKKSYREQRSCLDILEKMFEPSNKKSKTSQIAKSSASNKKSNSNEATKNKQKMNTQIVPSHPVEAITEARQQQQMQKRKRSVTISNPGLLNDDEFFEITNNGTFGSVMRLHSNGVISPVQTAQKANSKQHNKITNYLIGNAMLNGSQEDAAPNSGNSTGNMYTEAGTPSKRQQQLHTTQSSNVKKSPKTKCNTTQATKLTKWFVKPSEMSGSLSAAKPKSSNLKKTPTKQVPTTKTASAPSSPSAAGKRILKRRRLDLSFSK